MELDLTEFQEPSQADNQEEEKKEDQESKEML